LWIRRGDRVEKGGGKRAGGEGGLQNAEKARRFTRCLRGKGKAGKGSSDSTKDLARDTSYRKDEGKNRRAAMQPRNIAQESGLFQSRKGERNFVHLPLKGG